MNQLKSLVKSEELVDQAQQEIAESGKITLEKEQVTQSEEFNELVTSEFDEKKE